MISRLRKEQEGLVLPLALVALGVGVMIITPFLSGMSTTLISSRNSQASTNQQYAADGAYEDAVWNLTNGNLADDLALPCDSTGYTLEEAVNGLQPSITVTRAGQCGGGSGDDDDDDGWSGDDGDDDDDGGGGGQALTSITYQISITAGDSSSLRDAVLYFCTGMPATVMGTDAAETLTGTDGNDVIIGLGGNDSISGGEGHDVICGGAGNDTIYGGGGDDQIYGGEGADQLSGESGDDVIAGESGGDVLNGGTGDDSIDGGPGTDACDGGPGDDTLSNCGDEDDD